MHKQDHEAIRLLLQWLRIGEEQQGDALARKVAKSLGYGYYKITVTDVDTGEVLVHELYGVHKKGNISFRTDALYTVLKPEHLERFAEELRQLAMWPKEVLDMLEVRPIDESSLLPSPQSFYRVEMRQLLGGRPKGKSRKTQEKYMRLAEYWYKVSQEDANLTQAAFCRKHGIAPSVLNRALKYRLEFLSKNAP